MCTLWKQTLSNMYLTLIRKRLEYDCEILGVSFEREITILENVQIESVRLFQD